MSQLQGLEPELTSLGYEIIALAPDKPDEISKMMDQMDQSGRGYTVLSDQEMSAARAFGVSFTVDEKTRENLTGFGIDLEAASGKTHHQLPVPAVFIAGTDGTLRFTYVNPDYRIRIHPDVVLAAAKAALDPESWNPKH